MPHITVPSLAPIDEHGVSANRSGAGGGAMCDYQDIPT